MYKQKILWLPMQMGPWVVRGGLQFCLQPVCTFHITIALH